MKSISLGVIGVGVALLAVAFVETLIQVYPLKVHPMSLIELAATLFVLAIALMCHSWFYGSAPKQK